MSTGAKMPLERARAIADRLVADLSPACRRIVVAGSIRRQVPEVGDVELVAEPLIVAGPQADLFATPPLEPATDAALARMLAAGTLAEHADRPADGPRYKRLMHGASGIQVDLFLVRPPAQWAVILAIRTGPAERSRALVTELRRRGLRCQDGAIWNGNEILACPTERDVFALAGLAYVPPEHRR